MRAGSYKVALVHYTAIAVAGILLAYVALRAFLLLGILYVIGAVGGLIVSLVVGALAGAIPGRGEAKPNNPWTLVMPVALNAAILFSLVSYGYSNLALMGTSMVVLFLANRGFKPPEPDMARGVIGGFAAFIVVLVLSLLTNLFLQGRLEPLGGYNGTLLYTGIAPAASSGGLEAQFWAFIMLFVVAVSEEMWRAATYYNVLANSSHRLATVIATTWFLFMHVPSRMQYGLQAPVIIALIGIATLTMWFFARGDIWAMVVAHGIYNTALAGIAYGMLPVELLLLAIFVYAVWYSGSGVTVEIPEKVAEKVKGVVA
ncbi:CPBP family glutamic-type intramembrane protease [Thermofilum pendens]|uniref:Abortive infection protein n=1 Tax=Thermofilum pendens (strain DSM 2475 / Hrk 5) TaxID=368408 RepID=A1S1A7_THEPD|nr:CPBP family glutamic-type intramembrane protease [Thermofilum pendens]ABL79237.1 Abortive infection protein [Thermofilum pendens Hrk 5]